MELNVITAENNKKPRLNFQGFLFTGRRWGVAPDEHFPMTHAETSPALTGTNSLIYCVVTYSNPLSSCTSILLLMAVVS